MTTEERNDGGLSLRLLSEETWIGPELQKAEMTSRGLYEAIYNDPRMHAAFMVGKHAKPYKDIEEAFRYVIEQLGLDPDSQHFARTPERVAKVLRAYSNPDADLEDVLSAGFEEDDGEEGVKKELVVQTNIPFMGMCAHHLLPFFGAAAVGYLPTRRVVGLSKLTRLVYAAGHVAPTTQEEITNAIADTLFKAESIQPAGVAVITSALHGCMAIRGVEAPATRTIVSVIRGAFQDVPALEAKFMTIAMEGLR